jgi:acyl-CoA synthetase (AMP-forming)/AMP-acid ligase II
VTAAHQTGQTLVEVLRRQAIDKASAPAVTFLNGSAGVAEPRSFAALDRRARRLAARLQDHVPCLGERALVLLQPGLGFIEAFLGCLYAGVVAVPLTMPRPNRPLIRLTRIALDARPRFVFATADQQAWLASQAEAAAWMAQVIWLSPEHDDAAVTDWRSPDIDGDSLAFLQYTSGSTRAPRGVMVRHRNILANLALIAEAFGDPEARPIVSWLPPYHDMGLIGTILAPLYTGQRAILMSPLHFLQRPLRWLEAISRYRAATSGGPTFAYDLCVRRIPREQRRDLDLSCWATAFIGSEPVRAEVLDVLRLGRGDASGYWPGAHPSASGDRLRGRGLGRGTGQAGRRFAESGSPAGWLRSALGRPQAGDRRPGDPTALRPWRNRRDLDRPCQRPRALLAAARGKPGDLRRAARR